MRDYLARIGGAMPGDVVSPDDVAAYSMNPTLDFETIMRSLQAVIDRTPKAERPRIILLNR